MNKKYFFFTFLLLTSSVAHLLGGPICLAGKIAVVSTDDKKFEIEKRVLESSGMLKNMLEDCFEIEKRVLESSGILKGTLDSVDFSGEFPLGVSSEDFQRILPFLKSIYESKDNIQEQLSEKESSEIASIIKLADFLDVPQIIDYGSNVIKGRFDTICAQHQEGSERAIESFLASIKSLSSYINQKVVGKVIKNHPVKTWLFNKFTSGKILQKEEQHEGCFRSAFFISPDGNNYLATASRDNTAKILDIKTGQLVHILNGHTDCIERVAFSPDYNYLATASRDNTAIIWDVKTGLLVHTLSDHTDSVTEVVFSLDGNYLATVSGDNTAIIWDVKTGGCVHTLNGHASCIDTAAFSPDGNYFATGLLDNTAIIWDVKTGLLVHTLSDLTGGIMSLSFSPDCKYLATESYDHRVRIWDIKTNECVYTLSSGTDAISRLFFSLDGNYLAARLYDHRVRIWDVGCLNELKRFLSGEITLKQAVILTLFYKNRDNKIFTCPESFAKDFKSLPESIKKAIPEKIKAQFPSRFSWIQRYYSFGLDFFRKHIKYAFDCFKKARVMKYLRA